MKKILSLAAALVLGAGSLYAQEEFDLTIEEESPLVERGGKGTYGTVLSKLANFVSLNGFADTRLTYDDERVSFEQSQVNLFVTGELSDRITTEFNVGFEFREVEIEYAFFDYEVNNKFIVRAGKFLLPTGDFNEYTSLSYLNRVIDDPLTSAVSPSKWSNVGLQIRGKFGAESSSVRPYYAVYVVNGLSTEFDEEEEEGDDDDEGLMRLLVEGGEGGTDNNNNKGIGGQFGIEYEENLFASVSYHTSKYDSLSLLAANVMGFSTGYDNKKLHVSAEYHMTMLDESEGEREELSGFFVTSAYRFNKFEPVLRYDQNTIEDEEVSRVTAGINYYFRQTGFLKANFQQLFSDEENESSFGVALVFTF